MGFFSTDVGAATNAGLLDDAKTQALVQARNDRRSAELEAEAYKRKPQLPTGTPAGVARPATTQIAAPSIDNAKYFEDLYKDSAGAYATEGVAPGTYKPSAGVSMPSRAGTQNTAGVRQIPSDAVGFNRVRGEMIANRNVSKMVLGMADSLSGDNLSDISSSKAGRGYGYFTDNAEEAKTRAEKVALRGRRDVASRWYKSKAAKDFFRLASGHANLLAYWHI